MGLLDKIRGGNKEERERTKEADKIYSKDEEIAYEAAKRRGRIKGAEEQGYKEGRSKGAKKSSRGAGLKEILSSLDKAGRHAEKWGNETFMPPKAGTIGLDLSKNPFDELQPRKNSKKKKKRKIKKIVYYK